MDEAAFEELHKHAFEHGLFLERAEESLGSEPNRRVWNRLRLPGPNVLEIGPGSGHLLAAAKADGRNVWGIESSKRHRDYISERWGIDTVNNIAQLPSNIRYDLIIAINVVEHVYNVRSLLGDLRRLLAPSGRIFVSTVNAEALALRLAGTKWTMFKEPDHVSFPSAEGIRVAAEAKDLLSERVWSTELPLETLIGLAATARDFRYERRFKIAEGDLESLQSFTAANGHLARRVASMIIRYGSRVDPTSRLIGRLGRAGTIKATLIRF